MLEAFRRLGSNGSLTCTLPQLANYGVTSQSQTAHVKHVTIVSTVKIRERKAVVSAMREYIRIARRVRFKLIFSTPVDQD